MPRQRKLVQAGNRKRSTGAAVSTRANASRPTSSPTRPTGSLRPNKKASILGLLQRPQGAAISDLTAATGWQSHSVRAALTGLRKEGCPLLRDKDDSGIARYRISKGG